MELSRFHLREYLSLANDTSRDDAIQQRAFRIFRTPGAADSKHSCHCLWRGDLARVLRHLHLPNFAALK